MFHSVVVSLEMYLGLPQTSNVPGGKVLLPEPFLLVSPARGPSQLSKYLAHVLPSTVKM